MTDQALFADIVAITDYGRHAEAAAVHLRTASEMPGTAPPLDSVFGLIGGDFLDAYAKTAAAHVRSLAALAVVVCDIAAATRTAALGYRTTDSQTARGLSVAEHS